MSYVDDHLNRRLLEDTFDLYNIYKHKEVVELIADNVRVFEEIWHYREAAICAFVARKIAETSDPETDKSASIKTLSRFKHPTTVKWYDRLREMWPAVSFIESTIVYWRDMLTRELTLKYIIIHWARLVTAEPPTGTNDNSSKKSSPSAAATQPAENKSSEWSCSASVPVLTPDTTTDGQSAGETDSIADYESEPGMEGYDMDAGWHSAGYGIAQELNTSSDWYEPGSVVDEVPSLEEKMEQGSVTTIDKVDGEYGVECEGGGRSGWRCSCGEEDHHTGWDNDNNSCWGAAKEHALSDWDFGDNATWI